MIPRDLKIALFSFTLMLFAGLTNRAVAVDETEEVEPKRYALLVAVTKYQHTEMNKPALEFPEVDAKAVGEFLEAFGYEVEYLLGPKATKLAIEKKLDGLADKGNDEGTVVLGFWGHGVEFEGTDESMFCPYDSKIRTVVDSKGKKLFGKGGELMIEPDQATLVGMSDVLQGLRLSGAGNRLLLADCCRNSPNRARGRAFGSKTKLTDLPDNTAALFACSESEQAFEDETWGHGAFTKCLLDLLPQLTEDDGDDVNSITGKLKRNVAGLVKERSQGRETQTVNPIFKGTPELQLKIGIVVYVGQDTDIDKVYSVETEFTYTVVLQTQESREQTYTVGNETRFRTVIVNVPHTETRATTLQAGLTIRQQFAQRNPAPRVVRGSPGASLAGDEAPPAAPTAP